MIVMIHRIRLTSDAELELEDSLNIVLVTPERRITITNLNAWQQALGNVRMLRDVAANTNSKVGDPNPTPDPDEDGPFCEARNQDGYECIWLRGHEADMPHVAGTHAANDPSVTVMWTDEKK